MGPLPDNLHLPLVANINFEEEAVFEALSCLSGNSAPSPDGMQASIPERVDLAICAS